MLDSTEIHILNILFLSISSEENFRRNPEEENQPKMNILQISAPKSGSYWLHSILIEIFQKTGLPRESFICRHPIYPKLKDKELSFKDQAGIDMIDIEEKGYYYRVSSFFRQKIEDITDYAAATSLAWTHSTLCKRSFDALPVFDKKVMIVRDPRDRALSSAKFAFTPYMLKHYPTDYSTAEEFLENEYERLLEKWMWHVGNYLLNMGKLDMHVVFYERLLLDFDNEFQELLNYLAIDLSKKEKHQIAKAVSFSTMKTKSPKHLQKGKYGKWESQLNDFQKKIAVEKVGTLLKQLNYPLEERDKLPSLPKEMEDQPLRESLKKIHWQELYK